MSSPVVATCDDAELGAEALADQLATHPIKSDGRRAIGTIGVPQSPRLLEHVSAETLWVLIILRLPAAHSRPHRPILGFWQFRTAILLAAVDYIVVRRRHLTSGRSAAAIACSAVTAGFLVSRTPATDPNLPLSYGDQPGMAVFLWSWSAFIMCICFDIARVCHKNLPNMPRTGLPFGLRPHRHGMHPLALVLLDHLLYGTVDSHRNHCCLSF